ncbi:MAG: PAS domain S-box protein, partial [Kovacikia sp.]
GLDGGIAKANPAFCALTGYTEAQLRHLDNQTISYAEDFLVEVQLIQQMLADGQQQTTFCKRYLCCDGSLLWTEVKLFLMGDVETGEVIILTFVTDTNAHKRAENREQEPRLSAEHFRLFVEASTDVFVEYDAQLRYVSINPVGSNLLGLPPEQVMGKTNRELLGPPGENLELLIQQAFDTGEKVFVDHEFHLPNGVRIFETIYTPIANSSGTIQRVLGICRDVTEFKQHWQNLETRNHQLTEAARLKEEFVATTSHELRTPLTAILGFSNVLLQEFFGELNPKQKDYLERIYTSGQHLLDLINDILDMSRLEADRLELDFQTIFVPDICEGVVSLIHERAINQGLRLEVELEPQVEWIIADPRRLKQMLLNLLTNAVKFTQEGSIGLKVYCQPDLFSPSNEFCQSSGGQPYKITPGTIHFLIWDTGIGIDVADQKLLFAPFAQIDSSLSRKHKGTGLGLVITRKLAELHGGTVTLESAYHQGAKFLISLPMQGAGERWIKN